MVPKVWAVAARAGAAATVGSTAYNGVSSSNRTSSQRSSIKSSDWGTICRLGINSSGCRSSLCSSIGSCIAISSIVKTSGINVLGSNWVAELQQEWWE